ncbi:hypothetical protein [Streptomyces guryensis]|nr:hypothetical protein [Streptomyces guryensis]
MKFQFSFPPDTRVVDHPVRLAKGNLTAVISMLVNRRGEDS